MGYSRVQTVTSETVHGVTGKVSDAQTAPPRQGQRNTRTFFGDSRHNRTKMTQCCQACGADHQIWTCQVFKQKCISDKWDIAKCCQLCFRCLAEGHSGRKCPRSRQCDQNGCKALHYRLLHQPSQETELKTADLNSTNSITVKASNEISSKQTTSGTERNKPWQQTTMMANNVTTTDFIALRTVPIILKNGNRSIKVNALLDDASTKTYINADVAAELGLQSKTERVTVNVLNGQVETFETRPVDVQLESLIGDVKLQVTYLHGNKSHWNYVSLRLDRIHSAMGAPPAYKHSQSCKETSRCRSYRPRLCRSPLCTSESQGPVRGADR